LNKLGTPLARRFASESNENMGEESSMKLQYRHAGTGAVPVRSSLNERETVSTQNKLALMTLVSGIVMAGLLALMIGWSMFDIISDFKSAATLKARNHELIATFSKLQIHLGNAEKSERGYIAGSELSVAPYVAAVEEVRWTTDLVHALVSKDPLQRKRAVQLEERVEARLATLQFLVEMREAGNMRSAQLLMSSEQDNLETERVNDMLKEMENHENTLLNEALLVRDNAYGKIWSMLAAVTFFLFGGAVWQYRRVRRLMHHAANSQAEMRYLANHDALTGLPNRRLLQDRLDAHIGSAGKDCKSLAVMYMDLDGFKKVNDTIGHDAGDELLQHVARRLKASIRASDTVARIGGDEFIVVVPELDGPATAAHIAGTLVEAISKPYSIKGRTVSISTSIGISLYPGDGTCSGDLLNAADQALNQAKNSGKNQYRFALDPASSSDPVSASASMPAPAH
jgi:diguanylate cyclase (GGDEF)-like protein